MFQVRIWPPTPVPNIVDDAVEYKRPLLLPTMPEPKRAIVVEPFASTVKS